MGTEKVRYRSPPPAQEVEVVEDSRPVVRPDPELGVGKELAQMLDDELARDVETDTLPADEGDRARVLRANSSPDLLPWIMKRILRMRMAGMRNIDIAKRLRIHERTVYKIYARAKKLVMAEHTNMNPAALFADHAETVSMMRERLMQMFLSAQTVSDATKAASAMVALNNMDLKALEMYGYFDAITFGKLATGGGKEEKGKKLAKALEKIMMEGLPDEEDDTSGTVEGEAVD